LLFKHQKHIIILSGGKVGEKKKERGKIKSIAKLNLCSCNSVSLIESLPLKIFNTLTDTNPKGSFKYGDK